MQSFDAELEIIDGNPYVPLPSEILEKVFEAAGRDKSPIPVHGSVNSKPYRQTLVKFRGDWRLYVNLQMLDDSPRRIGEVLHIEIQYDPVERTVPMHPKLAAALAEDEAARAAFDDLVPSRQTEILRYIDSLKKEESVDKNVARTIRFLTGRDRFVGRDSP